ncbi:uncharacterized protein LOC129717687 isoform X2 [Wyeomyia smithii]|uniref:uncharacterized protein LOC129717687 isoform X2 n=1 Tax=Wyeomyia smithii TaxID=174621 RepID=UPI002467EF0C|nr:uncharacterized protein LOC129717687 isoform X2 [Wyeomyia smithii]
MHICVSCQAVISHGRSVSRRKRRTDEYEATQDFEDPQPSTSKSPQESTCENPQPSTIDAEQPLTSCDEINDMLAVPSVPSLQSIGSVDQLQGSYNVEKFKSIVQTLEVSPVSTRSMRSTDYRVKKSTEITQAVRRNIFGIDSTDMAKQEAYDEMIMQLLEKFKAPTTSRNDQVKYCQYYQSRGPSLK